MIKLDLNFPTILYSLVPETEYDVKEAEKCIKFDVFSGLVLHLHRINIAVLEKYWELVTSEPKIKSCNLENYVHIIRSDIHKDKGWDQEIISIFDQIIKFHPDPLSPSDQKFDFEKAVILSGMIRNAISLMISALIEIEEKAQ